jgi:predicted enzyme related to lactoylglutathione lyase
MAGEIVHIEFPSENADRAQQFWSGLFGWEFGASPSPEMDYRMAQTGETSGVAVFPSNERTGHPNYYFLVDDIDASVARVRELGGHAEEKGPVPGHGWYAACRDSEGNAFHLWQGDTSAGQDQAQQQAPA